jgi:hypothetical protein
MKTLIVAGNQHHAADLRKQVADTKDVVVTMPGERLGQRYDLILVTDLYTRERHFALGRTGEMMDAWFEESVRTRLGSPEAKLIML